MKKSSFSPLERYFLYDFPRTPEGYEIEAIQPDPYNRDQFKIIYRPKAAAPEAEPEKKDPRGGARKGSGRKPLSQEGRTRQVSVSLKPDEYEAYQELRSQKVNVNRLIGKALKEKRTASFMRDFEEKYSGESIPNMKK